ncbi:MAG: cation transporter [Methanomassiliicoccaceae archaeon]|nr:cation transporter [Methanomassiliicoccaceae archaeon]
MKMKYVYKLEKLQCAACAAKMEREIGKIEGVRNASVVFMTMKLTIEADESDIASIESEASKAIRRIEPDVMMKKV